MKDNGRPSVPRDCRKVLVRPTEPGREQEVKETLSHELAHACNVKHHGDGAFKDILKGEYLEDTPVVTGAVIPRGTTLTTDLKHSWSLAFESDSQASGDTHCYMGYKINFIRDPGGAMRVWDTDGTAYRARWLNPGLDRYTQNRFCDVRSTWFLGPAGPPAEGRGDCAHQFCVNHLKH
jgi:hypothetical protein